MTKGKLSKSEPEIAPLPFAGNSHHFSVPIGRILQSFIVNKYIQNANGSCLSNICLFLMKDLFMLLQKFLSIINQFLLLCRPWEFRVYGLLFLILIPLWCGNFPLIWFLQANIHLVWHSSHLTVVIQKLHGLSEWVVWAAPVVSGETQAGWFIPSSQVSPSGGAWVSTGRQMAEVRWGEPQPQCSAIMAWRVPRTPGVPWGNHPSKR